jgi:hypothetical protein
MAHYLLLTNGCHHGKITIKFLAVHIEDEQVDLFIKKIDEVLKRFAGDAYNFRYDVEELHFESNTKRLKHQ